MKIFSSSNDVTGKAGKFLGFYVDSDMEAQVSLMSLGLSVSKSKILRSVIKGWLLNQNPVITVAKQASALKAVKGTALSNLSEVDFVKFLKQDLAERGIPKDLIQEVVGHYQEMPHSTSKGG